MFIFPSASWYRTYVLLKSKYNVFLLAQCCNTRLNFPQVPIDVTKGPESIECFIEDQASHRRVIWLLPRPPPHSRQHVITLSLSSCVSPVGRDEGVGKEPKQRTTRKPGVSHSTLSAKKKKNSAINIRM